MKVSVADIKEICDSAMFYMIHPFTGEEKEMDVSWFDEELGNNFFIENIQAEIGDEVVFCYVKFDFRIWGNPDYFF